MTGETQEAQSAETADVRARHAAYRFFREWAGGIVGENAKGALDLARAEQLLERAVDLGIASVEWVDDDEPYDTDGYTDDEIAAKFDSNEWTGPFGCVVSVHDGNETTDRITDRSLWGIVVGPRGTDDPYCRVVTAELATELEDDLRQAIGDKLDFARATPTK